jgi:hypothetical protein
MPVSFWDKKVKLEIVSLWDCNFKPAHIVNPKVKEARSRKKVSTATLKKLMQEAIDILKNDMDHLVNILDGSFENFVMRYKNARSVDNYHGRGAKPEPAPEADNLPVS